MKPSPQGLAHELLLTLRDTLKMDTNAAVTYRTFTHPQAIVDGDPKALGC